MAIAPPMMNPIHVSCKKCNKVITCEIKRYDEWMTKRGYFLCYNCSGQRTLSDFEVKI